VPAEDHAAFLDCREYPPEMIEVVLGLRGCDCTVPGCLCPAEVLDHRVPFARGGRTSVENLYPMCDAHNSSKGDQDYCAWLGVRLRQQLLRALNAHF
jgi:5-methylcytosine-specific restriction endonuclease McrA